MKGFLSNCFGCIDASIIQIFLVDLGGFPAKRLEATPNDLNRSTSMEIGGAKETSQRNLTSLYGAYLRNRVLGSLGGYPHYRSESPPLGGESLGSPSYHKRGQFPPVILLESPPLGGSSLGSPFSCTAVTSHSPQE